MLISLPFALSILLLFKTYISQRAEWKFGSNDISNIINYVRVHVHVLILSFHLRVNLGLGCSHLNALHRRERVAWPRIGTGTVAICAFLRFTTLIFVNGIALSVGCCWFVWFLLQWATLLFTLTKISAHGWVILNATLLIHGTLIVVPDVTLYRFTYYNRVGDASVHGRYTCSM